MRTPTKFVHDLTDEQQARLKAIMRSTAPQRKRMRAHAILLSARQYSIDQIAAIYEVDRDRVSQWLEWWSESQFDGLEDDRRSGRPPKLTAAEQEQTLEIIKEEPRSTRRAVSEIGRRLKKRSVGGGFPDSCGAHGRDGSECAAACGDSVMGRSFGRHRRD